MNEDESVIFTLQCVGLPSGTKLAYTLGGISADDLTSGSLTGEFTLNSSGIGTVTVNIKKDYTTETNEVLKCYLTSFPNVYAAVLINDTSQTPTYKITISANSTGTTPINSIDEGKSFYVVVETTDVDNDTNLYLTYGGTADSNDYTTTLPTTINIDSNGKGFVTLTLKDDYLTEGNESFLVNVGTNNTVAGVKATTSVTINDTSKTKKYTAYWSSNSTVVS